ncbi:MAG: SRPBCC domain-containing protein [Gammaproteobacteria bacterium]|nr:SRPBCC domain-containing protein [Gammaproteobacteria bacterium]
MNEVRRAIHLAAPVQRVWAFLTDPQKLSTWLMDSDFSTTPGARFKFTSPPSGRWDGTIHCEIKDVIENERISYTWCANDIGETTLVTFDLEPSHNGTRLTLTHEGFEKTIGGASGRHDAGWSGCLKALRIAVLGSSLDYDWSEFQITYFVDASIQEVFGLWATAHGMARFWADEVTAIDTDGQARSGNAIYDNGDRIHLRFPTQAETELEILNVERDKFILFSFGEDYGWVHVSLTLEGGRTRVVLRQFGMPDDTESHWEVHANARGWWVFNLMNIQSVLVHGYDLRVREPASANGLGALYQLSNEAVPKFHDWTLFDVHLYMDATPADVLRYWQTVDGLTQFFIAEMTACHDNHDEVGDSALVPGSRYRWHGIHDYHGEGQFLRITDESVEFTFGPYRVEVSVMPLGAGTRLHLRQSGIGGENNERVQGTLNCRSCWIYFLVNLKSLVETRIDLRDKNPATADAISVGFNRS